MFDSVLVANRGEIAVRIMRTLRRLGIRSIGVYSDADAGARHVLDADLAMRIGPPPARQSYLCIPAILDAAQACGAQAIHPGYGFLSENADFARACDQAGLVFIGPPAEAIAAMGDKISAKQIVGAAGIALVPGSTGSGLTDADLEAAAERIGFPLLVKPSAGGGGKGMRTVTDPAQLPAALASARREARSAFGDDSLLLERLVAHPRHIEVQVLADNHGHVVHLGERECSLQRRHQKVIEEAPSPLLDAGTRAQIGAAAVRTASAVDYRGAGTIEFILDAARPEEFFFLEMNTRLQVEHPVTECVTGLDLVELQLRVAAGEPLPFGQAEVVISGHAIEARVYAEDPAAGFLPTGGPVLRLVEAGADLARTDSGLTAGLIIGADYDPMLSKVIAHGPDRHTALARLDAALAATSILGVGTNLGFLRALLRDPDVRAGRLDTGLIERRQSELVGGEPSEADLVGGALVRLNQLWPDDDDADLWSRPSGWRLGTPLPVSFELRVGAGRAHRVEITGPPTAAHVRVDGGTWLPAALRKRPDGFLLEVDGISRRAVAAVGPTRTWLALDGTIWAFDDVPVTRSARGASTPGAELLSPMPGSVIALSVTDGDVVAPGAALLVVEAMKMEHVISAPSGGTVELLARLGDQVSLGQPLARIRPPEAED